MKTSEAEDVVEIERRIAARPEIVFSYFTDPERFRQWQGFGAEIDPRPGGIFRVTQTGRSKVVARGEYVEVEPPKRLVFTWGWEQVDGLPEGINGLLPGATTVEVELVPDGDGTILRLRHSGLTTDHARNVHMVGWDMSLARLIVAAAGGDPGPHPLAES